jgi:hypothetical protein
MQILTDVQRIIESVRKQANYIKKIDVTEERASRAKNRLSKLMGLKSSLYENFKAGTLSKEEYLQKKAACEVEYKELLVELERFEAQKTQNEVNTGQNKWAAVFESFSKEKELSRELVISLIERIEVDSNCNVDITLKYRDEYEELLWKLKMEVPA